MNGQPLRLQVCNRDGECTFVKTKRPLIVEGVVVQIMSEDVSDVCEAITRADDELNEEDTPPWEDNFNLEKLRKAGRASREV